MKCFLTFCFLSLASTMSYADICPSNSLDTQFYKAIWKNEGSARGHVNCVYQFIHGEPSDNIIISHKQYDQKAIASHSGWLPDSTGYSYTCMNKNQANCWFG